MGSSKGRRGSGVSGYVVVAANSPHRLEQHEAAGGWPSRVKVLASSTLGTAASGEGGGRTIALTEEDFRKSGFKARETVAVLAGPHRLIAGRLSPLPSAALRPGGVGLASASARSLGCEDGARVRVRRLLDTPVTVLVASALELVLEAGSPGGRGALQASPHAYLEGFTPGRRVLLHRATGFCAHGVHAREGDQLLVSFEGVPHSFRVARLRPPRRGFLDPATTKAATHGTPLMAGGGSAETREESGGGDSLVSPLAGLSISELPVMAVAGAVAGSSVLPAVENSEKIRLSSSPPPRQKKGGSFPPLDDQGGNETVKGSASAAETSGRNRVVPAAEAAVSSAGNAQDTSTGARARLEAFYREHNPEKLDGIDGILTKYLGREGELFAKLEKKYGLTSSLRSATAGGSAGRDRQGGESASLGPALASPFSRKPSTPADSKAGAPPRTPSTECQRVGGSPGGGGDEAGIRGWGNGETLWLINPDTAIEISGADAPPISNGAAPEENSQENPTGTGGPAGFRRSREGAQGNGEDWGSVGGLSSQIQQLREAIELPLRSPEVLRRYGLRPPRGVLLHGPPGTGKTTLARAAAEACGCHVIVVNGSEVMSRFVGESEGALRQTFAQASKNAPCLIVFDEVDTLCPRRDQAGSEAQRRVVSTMLALLDGIDAQQQVVVIACTNRPQALDPALRRPGRLDSEVEVGVPDAVGRAEILEVLLRGVPHAMGAAAAEASTSGGERNHKGLGGGTREIAARTHGFVGADLQLLVKEAALQALRRTRGGWGALSGGGGGGGDGMAEEERGGNADSSAAARIELPSGVSQEGLPTLTPADFLSALPLVSPSGLREVAVEVPSVKWGDIGGMEGVKQSLREVVEWPLRHPEAFQRMGMSPPRGVLLYGPPGCSKTLMARALATESGMNFLAVKGPELLSKWLGESERAMQALFKRARAAAPTIIFFDEVDALASKRGGGGEGGAGATERVLTQLLTELDGIQPVKRLVVVAATNRPDVIDPALLRPGRLDRLVYVPPPDMPSRREILRLSLAKVPCSGDVDREELARRTEGFSGAEVVALCREASICALEEDRSATQVRQTHLAEALGQMSPQITPSVLATYASFQSGAV